MSRCHDAALIASLRKISDAWLGDKTGHEKGFSVGRFDPDYLDRFPIALVRREGRVLAFANVMQHYRDLGAVEFSLGMAPLAGLEVRKGARLWNRFGVLLFRHGGTFYNFEGLRAFK